MGWVGSGQLFGGLGWAGSMKVDPRTTLSQMHLTYFEGNWPVNQIHVNVVEPKGCKALFQCWYNVLPTVTV